jgi:hypothetical protein
VTKIAERLVEIDEDGLENLTDSTGCTVPEAWARVHDIKITAKSLAARSVCSLRLDRVVMGKEITDVERGVSCCRIHFAPQRLETKLM